MKRFPKALIAIVLCTLILFPACNLIGGTGKHDVHPPKDPKVASCDPGKWGGRLKLPLSTAPLTFNPFVASTPDTLEITSKLFAPLLDYDYVNQKFSNPPSGLARSIDSLPDGKTFVVHLREGTAFSNGSSLTAEDVLFSFQVAMDNRTESVFSDLMKIDGKYPSVVKDDNLTLRIIFPDHYEPINLLLARLPIVSKAALNELFVKGRFKDAYNLETSPDKIVSSGPFVLKSYTPDKQVDLDYNKYYWKVDSSGTSLPYLDGVTYFLKTSREAQGFGLAKNEFHAAQILAKDIDQFKGNQRYAVSDAGTSLRVWQLTLNTRIDSKKIDSAYATRFRTPGFLWALSAAIDRNAIVQEVFSSLGQPTTSMLTPSNSTWYFDDYRKHDYNPEDAKKNLLNLKYQYAPNGTLKDNGGRAVKFTILHLNDYVPTQIAQKLVDFFKKLGIQAETDPKEYKQFWRSLNLGIFDIALVESAPMFPDPVFLQPYIYRSGRYYWFLDSASPDSPGFGTGQDWKDRTPLKMNEALKKVLVSERKQIYNQAQKEWLENVPIIYLASEHVVTAAQSNIGNFKPAVIDPALTWNIEEFFMKN